MIIESTAYGVSLILIFKHKKMTVDETIGILIIWLDSSDTLQALNFDPLRKIDENIKYVENYLPIIKSKLKEENIGIYNCVLN